MTFQEKFDYKPLTREEIDGKRHYCTPDGKKVASVTTILDVTKSDETKEALDNWRKAVGHRRAQEITTNAANRGTRMHAYLEHYIKTGEMKEFPKNPYAHDAWYMAADIILKSFNNIDEFWGIEVPVYFPELYAGTTDCVGIWKGKPAIIDFKQSNKVKKEEWIPDYFTQLASYAIAHNELFGTDIKQGVILMSVAPSNDNPEPQMLIFEKSGSEFEYWQDHWWDRVEKYYRKIL